jgi:hypothetical protein
MEQVLPVHFPVQPHATPVASPTSSHRWCAPYPPLAAQRRSDAWPPSLQLLWQACRSAWQTLAALEAEATTHPLDTDLWRLVDAAHITWLDAEAYARPLAEAAERAGW